MTTISELPALATPTRPAVHTRRKGGAGLRFKSGGSAQSQPLRVARGTRVIGHWTTEEVRDRLAHEELAPTDSFYDDDISEWRPLAELPAGPTAKPTAWPCYCGTGLPFTVCCGAGKSD